jgi:hypothetical protein
VHKVPWALAAVAFLAAFAWVLAARQPISATSAHASSSVAVSAVAWRRLDSRCGPSMRGRFGSYPWPLIPFNREHPVRGYFGDPRTVIAAGSEGAYSFHNGIDISAWRGNRVYPVVSGRVIDVDGDKIVVRATARWRFQYVHLLPRVHAGEWVVASRTVIGTIVPRWGHIHLSEIRGGCVVNPLARGHLSGFRDTAQPQVRSIFFEDSAGRPLSPQALAGEVRVIAWAQDQPALPGPGQWRRMPVAPALVTWQLRTLRGRILAHGVAADFRVSEPPSAEFCSVYAPGTVQNFAAVVGVYRWERPGRFLFDLTPRPLATSRLHPGRYLVTATAGNLGGHTASRTVTIVVRALRLAQPAPARADGRCL